jgi:hypothetical protein
VTYPVVVIPENTVSVVAPVMAPVVYTLPPEKAPPVKFAALTHPPAVENPVPAVTVVPDIVVPATIEPVVVTVPPEKAPPVKFEAVTYPEVDKPVWAVNVVPETVPPTKLGEVTERPP